MSMISSQCDRLRERAATLRQGRWSDGEDDATLMERAADTIWELRNKLSGVVDQQDEIERLEDENARLRSCLSDDAENARQIMAENAKLVDVLHEVEAEAVHAYHCLQQDCVTTANSSEHFFKKWWHAECECDRLKAENAKLRGLVRDMWFWHYEGHIDSESQERQMKHIDGVLDRMRELGVGVSE
jgi:hypothetical protein